MADLCSKASSVLWTCPTSRRRSSPTCSFRILGADPGAMFRGRLRDLPVPVREAYVHAQGLRPRRISPSLALRDKLYCLPYILKPSASCSTSFSRLNTWPAQSPVNASAMSSQTPPHDSGPVWIATPSPYGTFIHYLPPVLTGAPIETAIFVVVLAIFQDFSNLAKIITACFTRTYQFVSTGF